MKKNIYKIDLGDNKIKYKVKLEDDPSRPFSAESNIRQKHFFKSLSDTPELLNCGPVPFEKAIFYHNGTCWCVELEAILEEKSEQSEKDTA